MMSGIGGGLMWFIIYAVYSLAFWYGVTLILESRENADDLYTPASIVIVSCCSLWPPAGETEALVT